MTDDLIEQLRTKLIEAYESCEETLFGVDLAALGTALRLLMPHFSPAQYGAEGEGLGQLIERYFSDIFEIVKEQIPENDKRKPRYFVTLNRIEHLRVKLIEAYESFEQTEYGVDLSDLGNALKARMKGFSCKKYGCSQFKQLIKRHCSDIFELVVVEDKTAKDDSKKRPPLCFAKRKPQSADIEDAPRHTELKDKDIPTSGPEEDDTEKKSSTHKKGTIIVLKLQDNYGLIAEEGPPQELVEKHYGQRIFNFDRSTADFWYIKKMFDEVKRKDLQKTIEVSYSLIQAKKDGGADNAHNVQCKDISPDMRKKMHPMLVEWAFFDNKIKIFEDLAKRVPDDFLPLSADPFYPDDGIYHNLIWYIQDVFKVLQIERIGKLVELHTQGKTDVNFNDVAFGDVGVRYRDNFAFFNTGIPDEQYQSDIILVFGINDRGGPQPYKYIDSCTVGDIKNKKQKVTKDWERHKPFGNVDPAHVYIRKNSINFKPNAQIELNRYHLLDNIKKGRYPLQFLRNICLDEIPQEIRKKSDSSMTKIDWSKISLKDPTLVYVFKEFEKAKKKMQAQRKEDPSITLDIWYVTEDMPSFAGPWNLADSQNADVVLIIAQNPDEQGDNGLVDYFGITTYTLDMALVAWRLMGRYGERNWLTEAIEERERKRLSQVVDQATHAELPKYVAPQPKDNLSLHPSEADSTPPGAIENNPQPQDDMQNNPTKDTSNRYKDLLVTNLLYKTPLPPREHRKKYCDNLEYIMNRRIPENTPISQKDLHNQVYRMLKEENRNTQHQENVYNSLVLKKILTTLAHRDDVFYFDKDQDGKINPDMIKDFDFKFKRDDTLDLESALLCSYTVSILKQLGDEKIDIDALALLFFDAITSDNVKKCEDILKSAEEELERKRFRSKKVPYSPPASDTSENNPPQPQEAQEAFTPPTIINLPSDPDTAVPQKEKPKLNTPKTEMITGDIVVRNEVERTRIRQIKVIGVGGAGCDAVKSMFDAGGMQGMNIQGSGQTTTLGNSPTGDLRQTNNAERGSQAAKESLPAIQDAIGEADVVFVVAGMDGDTGTGAAPIIAGAAKESGALTVGVVAKPISFEDKNCLEAAENGIAQLGRHVDSLFIIPSARLAQSVVKTAADEALRLAVALISEPLAQSGLSGLDVADVRRILGNGGACGMGTGTASGTARANDAARAALASLARDGIDVSKAEGILMTIAASGDMPMKEAAEAAKLIRKAAPVDVKFDVFTDDSMGEALRVALIASLPRLPQGDG